MNPTALYYQAFVVMCAALSAVVAVLASAGKRVVVTTAVVGAYVGCIVGLFVVEWFRSRHL